MIAATSPAAPNVLSLLAMAGPTFAELQRRLHDRLHDGTPETSARVIVACPSLSFPVEELVKIVGIQFYEERMLFLALLLRDPGMELVYPTSVPIDPAIVEYYLSWLPDPGDARRRLHLLAADDPAAAPLTGKLLARPDLVAALRRHISRPEEAHLLPFNMTEGEAALAEALGIPAYGPDPELAWLGSKSGARHLATEAGVAVFEGAGDLYSMEDLERALTQLRRARPDASAAVAKLNHGFSGQGNLVFDLAAVRSPLETSEARFCAAEESWDTYARKVAADGAIVEELAKTPGTVSPSVQLRILPGRRVEVVSTHDQILGGPDDQVYLGCRFPADDQYRGEIQDAALRVARVMADRGVIGSFGMDFVVVPGAGVHLSEINLRLGGTTHPFLMARYVSQGTYDQATGRLLIDGQSRVYKASDNLKSPGYVGLTPGQVIAAVAEAGLAYDPASASGATLHLLGAVQDYGKFGMVCIGTSHDHAEAVFGQVEDLVGRLG